MCSDRRRLVAALLLSAGCSARVYVPELSEAELVVPSATMPDGVTPQEANNNLDVVRFGGRTYLAFRTAPTHFAGPKTELFIVSSADEKTWTFEAKLAKETDLREPRFLAMNGRLFLYFAVLGNSALGFDPKGAMRTEYLGPGQWKDPVDFYEPSFIPWRTKVIGGVAYMVGYVGGKAIYDNSGAVISIHWLKSNDGETWEPAVPGQPVVQTGGGSETDFELLDDGSLIAVTRNEEGDETGWGSKICRARADDLGKWTCKHDRKKYDSPLVFQHDGTVYLIARRNLSPTGYYDLGSTEGTISERTIEYQLDYWSYPKRCALWRVDVEEQTVAHLADLASRGDTCFPGLLADGDDTFQIYNYSSPIDGPDLGWFEGQLGLTNIYRQTLTFR